MAINTFIDNFVMLAIEMILLKDLQEIFSPDLVIRMDKSLLNFVTAEPVEDQHLRKGLQERLEKLEEAKQLCEDYKHNVSRGRSQF